ncbi:MAG: hypothetical protein CL609_05900 [Anaerolineaceae bacterium]|nr:hypothetical protein [Anaerolineaceae bacterium]
MKTLRARLLLNSLIPILIILPVMGVLITYLLETQVLLGNLTKELTRQAFLVADASSTYEEIWRDPVRAQGFVSRVSPSLTAKLMLFDPTGHLIVSSDPEDSYLIGQVFDVPDAQLLLEKEIPAEITINNRKIQDIIVPVFNNQGSLIGFVRLLNPLATIYERSQTLREVLWFVLAGGFIVALILSWQLARVVEKPLRETTQAAYHLASGETPQPLDEVGPQETRLLLRAFNTLTERLQTLETSRKRLLANLVHELGRPLGALRSASQALLGGAGDDPQLRQELMQGMDDELVRLQGLLNELAHLHDQVLGPLELVCQKVNTAEWLSRFLPTWERLATDKKLSWQVNLDKNMPIDLYIDPDRLAQAVQNLISNAIRYTPPGGKITISALETPDEFRLTVEDTGSGISTQEQNLIFEPFQRGEAAQRLPEGMGLGLTIARDLVLAHNGRLTLNSTPGVGSRFTVCLPLTTVHEEPDN